jgi:hypothetical protein
MTNDVGMFQVFDFLENFVLLFEQLSLMKFLDGNSQVTCVRLVMKLVK